MKKCLAICKLENGVYQDGYAYFNYRELAKDLIDTYGPENFYEFPDVCIYMYVVLILQCMYVCMYRQELNPNKDNVISIGEIIRHLHHHLMLLMVIH